MSDDKPRISQRLKALFQTKDGKSIFIHRSLETAVGISVFLVALVWIAELGMMLAGSQ